MSQQDLANVMMRFRIDVTEATNALIYILYGINLVHLTAQGAVQLVSITWPPSPQGAATSNREHVVF
ncbi:MAG: hypothetical protein OXF11_19495 [Deltaproteobacteria bacterium]|nr:hypothetical protein [Deltaproteobacteria bacterium]